VEENEQKKKCRNTGVLRGSYILICDWITALNRDINI